MVKINKKYLIRNGENLKILPVRNKNESESDFLNRVTHLKLQSKYIDHIDNLKECVNVTTVYLQNNLLQTICNLESFSKLTHLHLQRNKISKIENLDSLTQLKKLYLGYNEIAVVEGLDNLNILKELHVEYQNLPLGETIYFDPRSIASLSQCLEVLNVAGNGLLTLSQLKNMSRLTELYAAENKICDITDLASALLTWPSLMRINMAGNLVATRRDFKDTVILNGRNLKYLDATEINATTRKFIEGWSKARKFNQAGEKGDGDQAIQATYPKFVHFTQLTKARDALPLVAASPLAFQPWRLRKNVNCAGDAETRSFRVRSQPPQ